MSKRLATPLFWLALLAPAARAELTVTTSSAEARAAFERGRDQYENQHEHEAQEEFRRALSLDPKFPSARSYLGMVIGGAQGLAEARRAVAASDGLPAAEKLLLRAHLERLSGREREARATMREASKAAPDDWRLLFYVGRLASLDRLSGLSLVSLRRAVELNPKAAPAWNNLGYTLANQNDYDGAIKALKTYEALLPGDPNPPDSLAEISLRAGRLDEAEKAFAREIQIAPGTTSAYTGIAEVRFMRGDWDGGRQEAELARTKAPVLNERQQAERLIAWSYLAQGRGDEALRRIRETQAEAHKEGAAFPEALAAVNEARMRIETGDAASALQKAEQVLALAKGAQLSGEESGVINLRGQLAVLLAALELGEAGKAKAAASALEGMHRALPEQGALLSATHFASGMTRLSQGDAKGAVAELSRCKDVDMYCFWKLIAAQRAAGEASAASASRAALLQRNYFDQVYLEEDPYYIYVRGRVAGEK